MKFVDLSIPLSNDVGTNPPPLWPKITSRDYRQEVDTMLSFSPGLTAGWVRAVALIDE